MKRRWRKRLLILAVILLVAVAYLYFNLPGIIVRLANRGDPLLLLDLRHATLHWHRLELSGVVFKLRGTDEEVVRSDKATIEFSWHGLREHRLGNVTVKKPRIRISDRLLDALQSRTASTTPGQATATWHVGKVTVVDGAGELDLANEPLIQFAFAPELHDLHFGSDSQSASPQQTVALENIELLSRALKPQAFGDISRIELKFSLREAAKLNFDELSIRSPSFHITPDALQSFAPSVVQATTPLKPNSISSLPSFRIGKLRIENGEVFIKDFGETMPEGSLKFGITTEDFQLGESGTALDKRHAFQVWDIRLAPSFAPVAPFALVDSLQIEFTPTDLLQRKEIAAATVTGMTITMGQTFRSFMNAGSKTSGVATSTPAPVAAQTGATLNVPPPKHWKLRQLDIVSSRVTLADLGVGTTSVGFNVETTLKNIPLSAVVTDTAEEMQQQEIADFTITSPLDSFAPVFTMKTLFIRYSIAGLLRREIEELQVLNPTIYVGEDLFWYFDELSKREEANQTSASLDSTNDTSWKLKKINVAYGQLVIANGGKASLPLPLQFTTSVENLDLGKLSEAKLALDLKVPQEDYVFPGYKLELHQLGGNIRFDLPPQTGQNNLVQTLRMKEVRWRQYRAEEGWLSVTFDRKGINGQIGAKGYGGYINGGFTSFFGETYPWVGWLSGTKVDLKRVTDVMAPGNFSLNGPAEFKLEASGLSSSLERLRGSFRTVRGGEMQIGKLDQILAEIPSDWYWVKRELTRILLETLRDFTYDTGNASFWYLNDEGNLKLTLQGPLGSRNIDVVLHGADKPR